jgi:small subunit ribosomal protein S17
MEQSRKLRKEFKGVVSSDKMSKTIVVRVDYYKRDAKYGKRKKISRKFYAHDENGSAHIGDTVLIYETRPYSRLKRFVLKEIVAKAVVLGQEAAK